MKHKQTITYWEFSIDILGSRYRTKAQRQKVHKILSRKRLREIEQAALLATKAQLPPGFWPVVS
jgi:hypothetical protein